MLFWLSFLVKSSGELSFSFDDSLLLTLSLLFLKEKCRCFSFIALDSSFSKSLHFLYRHLSKTTDRIVMIMLVVGGVVCVVI